MKRDQISWLGCLGTCNDLLFIISDLIAKERRELLEELDEVIEQKHKNKLKSVTPLRSLPRLWLEETSKLELLISRVNL